MRVASREAIKKGLIKLGVDVVGNTEEFNGSKGGIWCGGEGNAPGHDDKPDLMNYWSEDHENYVFGVHKSVMEYLEPRGWFAEWNDGGTIMIWRS